MLPFGLKILATEPQRSDPGGTYELPCTSACGCTHKALAKGPVALNFKVPLIQAITNLNNTTVNYRTAVSCTTGVQYYQR